MQINTTTAFVTALVSVVIGFGLAFYIERKLSRNIQKKSQKFFIFAAMMSFGLGLTGTLNEVIGFPLQGLKIRHDTLISYLFVNMLFLPSVFFGIAKLIGLGGRANGSDQKKQNLSASLKEAGYSKISPPASSIQTQPLQVQPTLGNWSDALKEYEGEGRDKGLWAKVFSEQYGDENKAKAQYLQIRATILHNSYSDNTAYEKKANENLRVEKKSGWALGGENKRLIFSFLVVVLGGSLIFLMLKNQKEETNKFSDIKPSSTNIIKNNFISTPLYKNLSTGSAIRWNNDKECFVRFNFDETNMVLPSTQRSKDEIKTLDSMLLIGDGKLIAIVYDIAQSKNFNSAVEKYREKIIESCSVNILWE